ncbi:carboxypeptidase-like regulatory domain-containing protein [Jejudonia soesokkakensis]|uniref:Carboxypeptidase-like regulatory domain-containing protein n=1 Tax=Jejudonia soesokkakensis TaxID=1323432 RepID=A0ABW2MR87_9FLAO
MRFLTTVFFVFFFGNIFGQITISGKVVSEKEEPLESASVYFNNTSVGVVTNEKGEFSITQPEGAQQLIVSYIGYETIAYSLNESDRKKLLIFKLFPQSNMLDEVVIKKQHYDEDWYYNLNRFKYAFIGQSELSQDCEILNPKDILFSFDFENNILTADTRKPLKIENKALGYLITYDLIAFSLSTEKVFFKGYTKFEELKKGKSKTKKWNKARQKAYNGSMIHFFKALQDQTLQEEGFIVNQFRRVLNPARPSEAEIKQARAYIKEHSDLIDFTKDVSYPITKADSAVLVTRKIRLPKFLDMMYATNVSYDTILTTINGMAVLTFEDYLSIVYLNEKEEARYLNSGYNKELRTAGPQTSSITLLNDKAILDSSGALLDPLSVFCEGYWAFEKLAETLPLNYSLPTE